MKAVNEKIQQLETPVKKEFYTAPEVEVFQLQVEKGFAASTSGLSSGASDFTPVTW